MKKAASMMYSYRCRHMYTPDMILSDKSKYLMCIYIYVCVCAKHACYDWSSYPQLKCPLSAGPQSSVSRQGCGATAGLSQESQHLGSP